MAGRKTNPKAAPQESNSEPAEAHLPCDINEDCTSSDAMTIYTDGHKHCFSCGKTWQPHGKEAEPGSPGEDAEAAAVPTIANTGDLDTWLAHDPVALTSRKITQATTRHWDYKARIHNGEPEHIAVYRNKHGQKCAVKIRTADKRFFWVGENKALPLYGQWLWGQGGKKVIVTEGEIDALTISQLQGHKWPVVSVPNGADNARKDVARNLEWLNTFEQVVFAFDMDTPGQDAALACAKLLPPGKAFIASLPEKDANAALQAGKTDELIRALWNAKAYRPDGIVCAEDLVERALTPPTIGMPWPWPFLTDWTFGRRYGEVYTFGAGTGVGKSDLINEIIGYTLENCPEDACAVFSWEAGPVATFKSIAGKIEHRRFNYPDPKHALWTQEEMESGLRKPWNKRLFLNDAFGATDWDAVKERIRFLVHSVNVRHVVLDPLTALAAMEDDERKFLERFMAEVAGLAQELQICIYLVSHLATPDGTPHEEGGRVTIRHFKGSRAIGQWSFFIFGLERNQQGETDEERKATVFRCLKDRPTGKATGLTRKLYFNAITGAVEDDIALEALDPAEVEALQHG